MEQWKDIPDYENEYEISDRGRIRSKDKIIKSSSRNGGYRMRSSRILKLNQKKNGYWNACLCKDGVIKTHLVHRLVAKTFLEKPKGMDFINHKNLNKSDNRVENLEWTTASANSKHAITEGAYVPIGHINRKEIVCVETGEKFASSYQAAEWLNEKYYSNAKDTPGMSRKIRACATGKQSLAYGFRWKDV